MEIGVNIHTYNTYGGNPSLSLVGEFFLMDLPDFGKSIQEISVNVYFRSKRGLKKSPDAQYNTFIEELPSSKFFRNKGRIEINFLSKIGDDSVVSGCGPARLGLFIQGVKEIAEEIAVIKKKLKKSDDFDADAFLIEIKAKITRLPESEEDFVALQQKVELDRKKRYDSMDEWEKLGIDWQDFHPMARKILNDTFFWDSGDDFAPNGNDTGADVLGFYQEWRKANKKKAAMSFFEKLMRDWEVVIPPPKEDEFSVTTYADSIVGLAFAQLKVDGVCDEQVRILALESLAQQKQRTIDLHKDWDLFTERIRSLELLESKLKEGQSTAVPDTSYQR